MVMAMFNKNKHWQTQTHKQFKRMLIYYDIDKLGTSLQIWGVIHFVKQQNDTLTTVKRLKMMKNELTYLLFG